MGDMTRVQVMGLWKGQGGVAVGEFVFLNNLSLHILLPQ